MHNFTEAELKALPHEKLADYEKLRANPPPPEVDSNAKMIQTDPLDYDSPYNTLPPFDGSDPDWPDFGENGAWLRQPKT